MTPSLGILSIFVIWGILAAILYLIRSTIISSNNPTLRLFLKILVAIICSIVIIPIGFIIGISGFGTYSGYATVGLSILWGLTPEFNNYQYQPGLESLAALFVPPLILVTPLFLWVIKAKPKI